MTKYQKLIRQTRIDMLVFATVTAICLALPSEIVEKLFIGTCILLLICLSSFSAYLALCASQFPHGRALCLKLTGLAVACAGLAAIGVYWQFSG